MFLVLARIPLLLLTMLLAQYFTLETVAQSAPNGRRTEAMQHILHARDQIPANFAKGSNVDAARVREVARQLYMALRALGISPTNHIAELDGYHNDLYRGRNTPPFVVAKMAYGRVVELSRTGHTAEPSIFGRDVLMAWSLAEVCLKGVDPSRAWAEYFR